MLVRICNIIAKCFFWTRDMLLQNCFAQHHCHCIIRWGLHWNHPTSILCTLNALHPEGKSTFVLKILLCDSNRLFIYLMVLSLNWLLEHKPWQYASEEGYPQVPTAGAQIGLSVLILHRLMQSCSLQVSHVPEWPALFYLKLEASKDLRLYLAIFLFWCSNRNNEIQNMVRIC
jgi:hypothetical protein